MCCFSSPSLFLVVVGGVCVCVCFSPFFGVGVGWWCLCCFPLPDSVVSLL